MAIQTEVWARDIAEALLPSNSFMAKSVSDDQWVENKTVHLPQSGALPTTVRNRASVPATAVARTDTDATYDLDEFTTDPAVIRDIEEVETSYDKRQSVLRDHIESLNLQCANWMQYHWGADAAATLLRTTGTARASVVTGATGNRKMLTITDIIKAKALMDDMDLPEEGRNLLMPAYMFNDLVETNWTTLLSMDISGQARIANGQLMQIFGFDIFKRGKKNLLQYTNAATPVKRTPDAANLATANTAALFWHSNFVRRAKGEVKVFDNQDDPQYYGSLFSALARAGGRKRYSDGTGVVAIVEDASA